MQSPFKYYRVIIHSLLWIIFFIFNISFFAAIKDFTTALERGTLITILYLFLFYSHWFIAVPHFFNRKKYLLFILFDLGLIITSTFIRINIEKNIGFTLPRAIQNPIFESILPRQIIVSVGASVFIIITSHLIRIADFYTINKKHQDTLLQQKTEAELKFLKAQLNPHFLFNALNNIYALVLTRSDKAADSLMTLSQLLRYIIYDTAAQKVSLEKEITYLKYYIDLESLRLNDTKNFHFDISIDPINYEIIPLIFIPFVENCFKHSDIKHGGEIAIKMNLTGNKLDFICENTFSDKVKSTDHTGGIGLENSIKRLEMLYPNNHFLTINEKDNRFCVKLSIDL